MLAEIIKSGTSKAFRKSESAAHVHKEWSFEFDFCLNPENIL
jgi:hypothetical protein